MRSLRSVLWAGLFTVFATGAHAVQTWTATEGRIAVFLEDHHLESLGLRIADAHPTADARALPGAVSGAGRAHAFAVAPGSAVRFRTSGGVFGGFVGGSDVPVRGGLAFRAWHPGSGETLPPAFLYDFTVAIDPGDPRGGTIRTADPALPLPLELRGAALDFVPASGTLTLRRGDLYVTEAWAARLGQPRLAGQWVGSFDLELIGRTPDLTESPAPDDHPPGPGPRPDVELIELYGITTFGRSGMYPFGTSGLSAVTTSCNLGPVEIPWSAPMSENHPFIGLAMYRVDAGGTLEMIGRSWMKHGNFAAAADLCNLNCTAPAGTTLAVGCSDTYAASTNASRFYLGPREEVNPYTGAWTACGSFFDATPVDCERDYFGIEADPTAHRLAVKDTDLDVEDAAFFYEAQYVVARDADPWNSIGWRECTAVWLGGSWGLWELTPSTVPALGPVVTTWGDVQSTRRVAQDDGNACLAVRVTGAGGGSWHYEYALFNWTSARGIRSFEVPVGTAVVTNVGFRDIDDDPTNDWTPVVANGRITWSTDDWNTDPNANALRYQALFNFRFDADLPPVDSAAQCGLFEPGAGTAFSAATRAPAPAAIARPVPAAPAAGPDLHLAPPEPNPFRSGTTVAFVLDRPRDARLSVVDVGGRTVRVLADGPAQAGRTAVHWDGRGPGGKRVAPGVYFLRLEAGGRARTVRATLLR